MALYKLHDFDPDYRDTFGGDDIKGMDVYTAGSDDKIGSISDAMVNDEGRFRYLIVDTGFWIFGKKVLLPVGQARIDYNSNRIYANLTREQVENLPNVNDLEKIDYEHEEAVRGIYRPATPLTPAAGAYAGANPVTSSYMAGKDYDRSSYDYEREPHLYGMNDQDHRTFRLYEERLIANKKRAKAGEVTVGKHVDTETQRVSVPVEKERVVIERNAVPGQQRAATDRDAFQEGEVARIEVYEETPDIHKEAVVREEVNVKKVSEQDVVTAEEQIRRESLDVDKGGNPDIRDRRTNR